MHVYKRLKREDHYRCKLKANKLKYQGLCKTIPQKHNHFFDILEFYLMYLFSLLHLINDEVGNERYYPTSAKQDGATQKNRKTQR